MPVRAAGRTKRRIDAAARGQGLVPPSRDGRIRVMSPGSDIDGPARWSAGLALAGIVAAMLLLAISRPPEHSVWWTAVYDLGHAPLFGFVALAVRVAVGALANGRLSLPAQYGLAFAVTAILSGASEVAQIGSEHRDANLGDALRDLAGAAACLLVAAGFEGLFRGAVPRAILVLSGVFLMSAILAPLGPLAWSYSMRRASLPVIADYTSEWQKPLTQALRVDLSSTIAPDGFTGRSGEPVARVRFRQAAWPGVDVVEPWPDWRGYDSLRFQVYAEMPAPKMLVLRIDDEQHNGAHSDRFNRSFRIDQGVNDIVVPLNDIRKGPRGRELDLSRIARVLVFSRRPDAPYELLFGPMSLIEEPGEQP